MIIQEPSLKILRHKNPLYIPGGFVVDDEMIFYWIKKRCEVVVPSGFVTNFASIPWFCRTVFPVNDDHRIAAVAHDFLYNEKGRLTTRRILSIANRPIQLQEDATIYYDRQDADNLFRQLMIEEQVKRTKRCAIYHAVRQFGATRWNA